jgi:cyclic pyranopterin phosphate synthase
MVVISGINDDELPDFAAKAMSDEWHIRFIEFMPLVDKGATAMQFVPVSEMRQHLELKEGLESCLPSVGNGPARYFRFTQTKGTIGFITPISEHFCFQCNRLRLTADGKLRPCLLAEDEIDLKQPLRSGISSTGLKRLIKKAVTSKPLHHHLAEGYVLKKRLMIQVGG